MGRFHIKENGEPGSCSASVRACPRGGENEHYDTADDARRAYEKVQEGTAWASVPKSAKAHGERVKTMLSDLDAKYNELAEEKARNETGEDRGLTGRQVADYHGQAAMIEAMENMPEGKRFTPEEEKAWNQKRIANYEYEKAHKAWADARATYDDPSSLSAVTSEELQRLADARDAWAHATNNAASEVIVRQDQVKQGDLIVTDGTEAADKLHSQLNTSGRPWSGMSADQIQDLERRFGEARKTLELAQAYYRAGLDEKREAKVQYEISRIDVALATARLEKAGELGPRPRFVGRQAWDEASKEINIARMVVEERYYDERAAYRRWNSLRGTE